MHLPLQQADSIRIKVPASPTSEGAAAAAAAEPTPIIVDRSLLAVYSSCAKGLPADATEWDVGQLVLGGQTVQRATVIKWLNAASKPIHGDVYEQQHNNPASSMAGLAQLLAFADAVGSSRGLLLAFDADAMDLTADVQLSSQTPVEPTTAQLQLGRGHRFVPGKRGAVSLMGFTPSTGDMTAIKDVGADRTAVQQQVAEQIEALLCLAYKLQLPVLKGSLCRVIACNSSQSVSGGSPLLDAKTLQTIMSNSLMAAAGCSNRDDMLRALFPQQLANVLHPMGGVTPVPAGGMASNYYEYSAQVAEDFMYYKKGDKVVVKMQHFLSPSFELWLDRLGTGAPRMTGYSHTVNVRHVMVPPGTMHI